MTTCWNIFKGRNCLINVDRSWFYWRDVIRAINRHGMKDQIILKSHAAEEELEILAEEGPDIMYLPILRDPAVLDRVRRYKVNLYGAEVIFETEDHVFCSGEFIEGMHRDQKKLWVERHHPGRHHEADRRARRQQRYFAGHGSGVGMAGGQGLRYYSDGLAAAAENIY